MTALGIGVVSAALVGLIGWLWRHRVWLPAVFVAQFLKRRSRYRVSIAVLVRVLVGGDLCLVRMVPGRPEAYGPLGGVKKFFPQARPFLDKICFEPQFAEGHMSEHAADLRGYLSGANLARFLRWVNREGEHESAADCARREIGEELRISGVDISPDLLNRLTFRTIRDVFEYQARPQRQVRLLSVLELADESVAAEFSSLLGSHAHDASGSIYVATADEVDRGRARNDVPIGSHAEYLVRSKSRGDSSAPIGRQG